MFFTGMRNIWGIFVLLFILSSCATGGENKLFASELSTQAVQNTATAIPSYTTTSFKQNPERNGYSKSSGYLNSNTYTYLYIEGRERCWEEIIVRIADDFLDPIHGHPYLTNREIPLAVIDEHFELSFHHPDQSKVNTFNESKREKFTESINEIISNIPLMTDMEIHFGIRKTIKEIDESHTRFFASSVYTYPLRFRALYSNQACGLYCTIAPKEHSTLLGCRLLSIDGHEISRVAELLAPYSHVFGKNEIMSNLLDSGLIYEWEALQTVGIVGLDKDYATFEFEDRSGNHFTATIKRMELQQARDMLKPSNANRTYVEIPKPYYKSRSEKFWYEKLDDCTLYIRVSSFNEDLGILSSELLEYTPKMGPVTNIILDLRDNTGGHYTPGLGNYIRNINADKIFVFTNGLSQSASIVTAQALRKNCPDITAVVGSYGWHTNFLGDVRTEKIENVPSYGAFEYTIPRRAYRTSVSNDMFSENAELFTPDIFLYYEYKDFVEGKDTHLEWAKRQSP